MNNTELTARTNQIAAAFQAVHNGIKGDALAMKLKMFFAGQLVNELKEIHLETFGETRGRPSEEEKGTAVSTISLNEWLEQHLGVTSRTCRRYHGFWQCIAQSTLHAGAVQALNKWWIEHRPSIEALPAPSQKKGKDKASQEALSISPSQSAFLSLNASGVVAKDLAALLEEADTLGLHELFEKPAKDVTPEVIKAAKDENEDRQLKLALQFWGSHGEIIRRLNRKDYLHLPPQEREALATTLEETLHEIKDTLRAKR